MGATDKPDNIQQGGVDPDRALANNNEATKNLRLNGLQTREDARSVSRDVIPANFIEAIADLKKSTDTLTVTYTTSLNFLINAVKEVQQLSITGHTLMENAQTQNASLIKSIQITQGQSEEVNLKTLKTLDLLIDKNGKEVKEQKPKTERSYKEFLLNDTIEGQLVSKVMGLFKDDKIPDPDVNTNADVETAAEALLIPPLQPVKVMEYSDEALRQLCHLFKNCINVRSTSTGGNGCVELCDKPGSILDKILSGLGLLSVARAVAPALTAAAAAAAEAALIAAAAGATAALQLLNSTIDNAVIKKVLNKTGEVATNIFAGREATSGGLIVIPATPAVPVAEPLPVPVSPQATAPTPPVAAPTPVTPVVKPTPPVVPETTPTEKPQGEIIQFPEVAEPLRKAAITAMAATLAISKEAFKAALIGGVALATVAALPEVAGIAAVAAVPLLIAAKSSATDVDRAIPKAKSTDEFTNFGTPKELPSFNNNIPISSDKATSLQYAAASVRGENFTSDSNTLLGDRFGDNAQALPVPAPISLILPVTSTESSINPNIIELTDTMKGLTAAFAKQTPNTEAGGTTNISTNNSSVSNTSSSFGGGTERDVIYMDRNKTRNQNIYRGGLY